MASQMSRTVSPATYGFNQKSGFVSLSVVSERQFPMEFCVSFTVSVSLLLFPPIVQVRNRFFYPILNKGKAKKGQRDRPSALRLSEGGRGGAIRRRGDAFLICTVTAVSTTASTHRR